MDFRKGTPAELFGSVMASSKKTFISNGTRPVFLSVLLLPELTGIDD